MVKYEVTYGVPFDVRSKTFQTEQEARQFIADNMFGDGRFCSLRKIETLEADFEIVNHYEFFQNELRDKMFNTGIVSRTALREVI